MSRNQARVERLNDYFNYLKKKKAAARSRGFKRQLDNFEYGIVKVVVSSAILFFNLVSSVKAGLSIVLTGGNWDIGTVQSAQTYTTAANKWNVSGSSDGREDIESQITGITGSGAWTAVAAANPTGANQFSLQNQIDSAYITTGASWMKQPLRKGETYNFGLNFRSPVVGSSFGNHTVTVKLTAKNWVAWCPSGYKYNGYCWYRSGGQNGSSSYSCNSVCASYGGCDQAGMNASADGSPACHLCHHFFGGYSCTHSYFGHCHSSLAYCHWSGSCRCGYGCCYWHGNPSYNWCMVGNQTPSHINCNEYGSYNAWAWRICACKE
jgi:hypothetical protein